MRGFFNDYVKEIFPARRSAAAAEDRWRWPGDEWTTDEQRAATWAWLIRHAPPSLERIVEYGPGSGKYTDAFLRETTATIVAYDISDAFIDVLSERFRPEIQAGRLRPCLMDWRDNEGLLRDIGAERGRIDFVAAIDVLMMMDVQSAFVYLLSSAVMLRRGGRLAVNFADGGTQSGFDRILRDAGRHSAFDPAPCTRFHWVDRTLVETMLARLGFGRLSFVHGPDEGLDIARLYVGAELVEPERAAAMVSALKPAGDSTNRPP